MVLFPSFTFTLAGFIHCDYFKAQGTQHNPYYSGHPGHCLGKHLQNCWLCEGKETKVGSFQRESYLGCGKHVQAVQYEQCQCLYQHHKLVKLPGQAKEKCCYEDNHERELLQGGNKILCYNFLG